MASDVSIGNQALRLIGEKTVITSLTDGSEPAKHVNTFFQDSKEAVLMDYEWQFAKQRTELSKDGTPPDFGFANRFQLPADYLSVVEMPDLVGSAIIADNAYRGDEWAREGQYMLANVESLKMVYVADVAPGQFTGHFTKCLVAYLASEIALSLAESPSLSDKMLKLYASRLDMAQIRDGMERSPDVLETPSDLIAVRQQSG